MRTGNTNYCAEGCSCNLFLRLMTTATTQTEKYTATIAIRVHAPAPNTVRTSTFAALRQVHDSVVIIHAPCKSRQSLMCYYVPKARQMFNTKLTKLRKCKFASPQQLQLGFQESCSALSGCLISIACNCTLVFPASSYRAGLSSMTALTKSIEHRPLY